MVCDVYILSSYVNILHEASQVCNYIERGCIICEDALNTNSLKPKLNPYANPNPLPIISFTTVFKLCMSFLKSEYTRPAHYVIGFFSSSAGIFYWSWHLVSCDVIMNRFIRLKIIQPQIIVPLDLSLALLHGHC